MSARSQFTELPKPVHYRLYDRFYSSGGEAVIDASASSHWQEYARSFSVRSVADDSKFAGYGFGGSGSDTLSARMLAWIGNALHLACLDLPNLRRDVREAKEVIRRMGLVFSQDAFRQVCTLNLLARQMQTMQAPKRVLIIGDGHGILSALIHSRFPTARIVLIDLGSVLFFQAYHLYKAFPGATQLLTDEDANGSDSDFSFCPADYLETLPEGPFDLAINIASMQEMAPAVTARYFALLRERSTRLFYCCNRLEKHLVGGEITRFMDYPWSSADEYSVDGPCPWHQWFFGRGSSPHVKILGFSVPLIHKYDGCHWHRLARLGGKYISD